MHVIVNGFEREVRDRITLSQLLEEEGEPAGHVVVEVNGAYVRHAEYDSRLLREGDRIEIILPAFGG